MIDAIWPRDTLAAVNGSTEGLTPEAVRIYDWIRGTYKTTGKPVLVGDVAYLFGTVNKVTENRTVPQAELAALVDASLVYVVDHDPAAVAQREAKRRAEEIRQMLPKDGVL